MYSAGPPGHQPPSYPGGPGAGPGQLVVIPGGVAGQVPGHSFPHSIPTSGHQHQPAPGQVPHPGPPHLVPGHMMAAQPATSMAAGMMQPQFHYMAQHQGDVTITPDPANIVTLLLCRRGPHARPGSAPDAGTQPAVTIGRAAWRGAGPSNQPSSQPRTQLARFIHAVLKSQKIFYGRLSKLNWSLETPS